jgi:hypothetical protein
MQKANTKTLAGSLPVTNNSLILQWLCNNAVTAHKNGKKSLTRNLVKELEQLFGAHNKGLRLRRLTKVWVIDFDGMRFNIFTASGTGTSIEVRDMSHEDLQTFEARVRILAFLEELSRKINEP